MNKYYIYIYLNPLKKGKYIYGKFQFDHEPFYIGKGKKFRYKEHLYPSRKLREKNHLKQNILNKIKTENKTPIIIKLYDNITEYSAFRLERYLINLIGRRDINKGTLSNMSDGGEGSSGTIMTYEKRINMCDVKDKIIQYNTEGKIIKIWKHITEVSINNPNYLTNHLHRTCKSNGSRKYDGYLWKYYNNENIDDIIFVQDKYKPILQYDLNGNFIKEWKDSNEVNLKLGISATLQCCRKNNKNEFKYKFKNFMWFFKDNNSFILKIDGYNLNMANGNGVIKKKNIKKYDLNNDFLGTFTPRQLKNDGFLTKTIYRCCNGELKSTQGYKWEWE